MKNRNNKFSLGLNYLKSKHDTALQQTWVYICVYVVQARYRKEQASTQPAPWIPPVDNLLKDSTDGSALGALLHFYCPQLLSLDGKEARGRQSASFGFYDSKKTRSLIVCSKIIYFNSSRLPPISVNTFCILLVVKKRGIPTKGLLQMKML